MVLQKVSVYHAVRKFLFSFLNRRSLVKKLKTINNLNMNMKNKKIINEEKLVVGIGKLLEIHYRQMLRMRRSKRAWLNKTPRLVKALNK